MDKTEFNQAMNSLKSFREIKRNISNNLRTLCSDFTVIDFTNVFEDSYIHLIELAMNDKTGWIDWFIYENDFGKKEMTAGYDTVVKPIKNNDDLYDLMQSE